MIDSLYNKFKDWARFGSIFIISDMHLDDKDCKYIDKNWPAPEEQIKIINQFCHKNDALVVLGDIGKPEWFENVKSRKILIMGNHDKGKSNYQRYFDEIYEGPLYISKKILLSHEPILTDFHFNIHGHVHIGDIYNVIDDKIVGLNLAANVCGYVPVSLDKIIKSGVIGKIPSIHGKTIMTMERK